VSLEIVMPFDWFSGHETCESHHPDGRQKGKFNESTLAEKIITDDKIAGRQV